MLRYGPGGWEGGMEEEEEEEEKIPLCERIGNPPLWAAALLPRFSTIMNYFSMAQLPLTI